MEITGTALDYDEVGVGDTVVFVHGTLGGKDAWELQVPAFAERHRTIAYTRRHHFGSQRDGDTLPLSPAQAALDLIELIELIGKPPVHLVGSSYGAFTSLLATVARPDLIRTLTLGEPPAAALLLEDPATAPMWKDFLDGAYNPARALAKSGDGRGAVVTFINGVIGPGVSIRCPRWPRNECSATPDSRDRGVA